MDLNEASFDCHETCLIVSVSTDAIVLPFADELFMEASRKSRHIAIRAFSAQGLGGWTDKMSGAILDQFTRMPAEAMERAAFSRSI